MISGYGVPLKFRKPPFCTLCNSYPTRNFWNVWQGRTTRWGSWKWKGNEIPWANPNWFVSEILVPVAASSQSGDKKNRVPNQFQFVGWFSKWVLPPPSLPPDLSLSLITRARTKGCPDNTWPPQLSQNCADVRHHENSDIRGQTWGYVWRYFGDMDISWYFTLISLISLISHYIICPYPRIRSNHVVLLYGFPSCLQCGLQHFCHSQRDIAASCAQLVEVWSSHEDSTRSRESKVAILGNPIYFYRGVQLWKSSMMDFHRHVWYVWLLEGSSTSQSFLFLHPRH